MKPIIHYDFQSLVYLVKINPTHFGGRYHLVSVFQCRGMRKKHGSKPTTTISAQKVIEKILYNWKRKLEMEQSISPPEMLHKRNPLERMHLQLMTMRCIWEAPYLGD